MLRVPILPYFNNFQYEIAVSKHAPGRKNASGVGTLGDWSIDEEKWKKADFHVFAYQTQNRINGQPYGSCDMQSETDMQNSSSLPSSGNVLLYNRIMRIHSSAGGAKFYSKQSDSDPTDFYFPTKDQLARYKLYAYYADNAEVGDIHRSATKVERDITIDGTQDVMHAFAYHSTEQFWYNIKELQANGVNEKELRMLCTPDDYSAVENERTYNNYLYSTMSAHHGFHPQFHVNRLMTRLNIYVAGGGVDGDKGLDDYKNLIVTGLSIRGVKTKGTLTIANDEWDATTYQADSMNIIKWDNNQSTYKNLDFPIIENVPFENSDYYNETLYPRLAAFPELKRNHVNVRSKPQRLVNPILLPPDDFYFIHLDMLYANRSSETNELNKETPFRYVMVEHAVRFKPDLYGNQPTFKQGNEYSIIVYVFGPQQVYISVVTSERWNEGGTINIDIANELEKGTATFGN